METGLAGDCSILGMFYLVIDVLPAVFALHRMNKLAEVSETLIGMIGRELQ
jgi:hypothetical protein